MQDIKPVILQNSLESFDTSRVHGVDLSTLRLHRLTRFRKLACNISQDHAWSGMGDSAILHDAGFLTRDPETGHDCVTVAGLLVLGSDAVIRDVFPGSRVEIKAQIFDLHGYDEQHFLHTNPLRTYQWLVAFLRRALPENGESDGTLHAPCLRDRIIPELITNFIVHRDYSVSANSRVVLQRDRIIVENPSRSGHQGIIELACSESHPKNPTLYRFFEEIGLITSPGSGLAVLEKHGEAYFGVSPLVFDRDYFRVFAPCNLLDENITPHALSGMQARSSGTLHAAGNMHGKLESGRRPRAAMQAVDVDNLHAVNAAMQEEPTSGQSAGAKVRPEVQESDLHVRVQFGQKHPQTDMQGAPVKSMQEDRVSRILRFCVIPRNREEIQRHMGFNNRDYFRKEILLPLLQKGLLEATIPDKPNSPNQKYRTASSPGSAI